MKKKSQFILLKIPHHVVRLSGKIHALSIEILLLHVIKFLDGLNSLFFPAVTGKVCLALIFSKLQLLQGDAFIFPSINLLFVPIEKEMLYFCFSVCAQHICCLYQLRKNCYMFACLFVPNNFVGFVRARLMDTQLGKNM